MKTRHLKDGRTQIGQPRPARSCPARKAFASAAPALPLKAAGFKMTPEKMKELFHSEDTETVKRIVSEGADVETRDEFGFTPLMMHSNAGHVETVRFLIEKKADVNARDGYGGTALINAAFRGHDGIVGILLANGAAWDFSCEDGTALSVALKGGHDTTAEILRKHGATY